MEVKLFLFALSLVVFLRAVLPFLLVFPKTLTGILLSSYLGCYHREQGEGAAASQERLLEGRYLLADAGIACQSVGVLLDGKLRGCCAGDLQHSTPLGKVSTVLLVLGTAFSQPIQPCRGRTKLHWELLFSTGLWKGLWLQPRLCLRWVTYCSTGHSLGSLDLSLPWMVVSPFVPARGAVPLSSWGGQKNRKGYRKVGIGLILIFLPMSSLPLKADC